MGNKKPINKSLLIHYLNIVDVIENISHNILFLLLATMVLIVATNIFTRYLIGFSISWAIEASIYLYIHLIYIATAIGIKQDTHVKINFVFEKTRGRIRIFLHIMNYLIMIGIFLFFLLYGMKQSILEWAHTGPIITFIPIGLIYLSVPLCGFLSISFIGAKIVRIIIESGKEREN